MSIVLSSGKKAMFSFTFSSTTLMVSTVVSNILVIRWVSPEQMGIWATLTLIQSYLSFLPFGVFSGLNREYPYLVGKNELECAQRLGATALAYTIFCGIFIFIAFAGGFLILKVSGLWRFAIAVIGIGSAIAFYQQYLLVTYRITHKFNLLGRIQLIQSFLVFGSVLLVWKMKFYGLCLRFVLIVVVVTIIAHLWRPIKTTLKFDFGDFKTLVFTGLPIMGFGYCFVLSNGFIRIIVLKHGGVALLGLFAPAIAIANAMESLPSAINAFVGPHLSTHYGKTNNPHELWSTTWKSSLATFGLLSFSAFIGWWLIPPFFKYLFPMYIDSLQTTRLMMVSGVFMAITAGIATLVTMKLWLWLGFYTTVVLLTRWFIPSFFTTGDRTGLLANAAFGWIGANAIIFVVGLIVLYFATNKKTKKIN